MGTRCHPAAGSAQVTLALLHWHCPLGNIPQRSRIEVLGGLSWLLPVQNKELEFQKESYWH